MRTDNPLDNNNPFIPGDPPPLPLEGIPQGRTPMDRVGGLAMKVAPFFMGPGGALGDFGITPLMATMNAMGVTNKPLLSAIMANQNRGPESPSDQYDDYYSTVEGI